MSYGGDRKPLNQAREEEPNKGERERDQRGGKAPSLCDMCVQLSLSLLRLAIWHQLSHPSIGAETMALDQFLQSMV